MIFSSSAGHVAPAASWEGGWVKVMKQGCDGYGYGYGYGGYVEEEDPTVGNKQGFLGRLFKKK